MKKGQRCPIRAKPLSRVRKWRARTQPTPARQSWAKPLPKPRKGRA
jgi:hypothetical protein